MSVSSFARHASLVSLTAALALAACAPDPTANAPAATVGSAVPVAEGTAAAPAAGSAEGTGAAEGSAAAEGTAAPVAAVAASTLTFGPATSTIGFVGSKVTGSHEGSFTQFSGAVALANPVEASSITIDILMDSVVTDNERLTGHLKSPDFFDTATYSTASFVSTAITAGATPPATHTITGNFTLHGQTHSISFPATVVVTPEQVQATAEFSINRLQWGIAYAGQADDLIREGVLIKLNIVATNQPQPAVVPAVPAAGSGAAAPAAPAAGSGAAAPAAPAAGSGAAPAGH